MPSAFCRRRRRRDQAKRARAEAEVVLGLDGAEVGKGVEEARGAKAHAQRGRGVAEDGDRGRYGAHEIGVVQDRGGRLPSGWK